MTITTPSKFEVHLKDHLTFGENRKLQEVLLSSVNITTDQAKNGNVAVPAVVGLRQQEEAFRMLAIKIVKDGQEITSNLLEEVYSWNSEDGQAVFDQIDKILNPDLNTPEQREKK